MLSPGWRRLNLHVVGMGNGFSAGPPSGHWGWAQVRGRGQRGIPTVPMAHRYQLSVLLGQAQSVT